MKTKSLLLSFLMLLTLSGCAGRLPTPQKSSSVIKSYFNKYARKYKSSPMGGKKVTGVEILSAEELHKKLASVQAFVTYNADDVYKVRATIEHKTFGWRILHWENLSPQPNLPESPAQ